MKLAGLFLCLTLTNAALAVEPTKAMTRQASADRRAMEKARDLFAKDQFDAAIAQYNQVDKNSDFWLEAVEEKGWAFHRKKSFNDALAQTKTLLSAPFLQVVGAEPFFLQSLTQLKICDYKGILETHRLFRETQRQRILNLQKIAKNGADEVTLAKLAEIQQFPLTLSSVGELAKTLPRLFYRDLKLQRALQLARANPNDRVNQLKMVGQRLQSLAQVESDENFKMLQKLNLIEIETIQRLHADQNLDPKSYQKGEFRKADRDDLVFPDDGNPWMDELDKYQVKVNSCPQDLRRKM